MEDRWDDTEAATFVAASASSSAGSGRHIGECLCRSRLIGADPSLVRHGGGSSSVKEPREDVTGKLVEAVHDMGSGWDLASIEAPGLAPLHLPRLHELLRAK